MVLSERCSLFHRWQCQIPIYFLFCFDISTILKMELDHLNQGRQDISIDTRYLYELNFISSRERCCEIDGTGFLN